MPHPSGALERTLRSVTLGTIKATRARDERNRQMGFSELDLQYQVAISGTANTGIAFTTITVPFEVSFFYAPGQRDSDLEFPTMTCGGVADGLVAISATVQAWHVDDQNGAIVGADVAIGVVAGGELDFTGTCHLNFQGWGALQEQESDLGELG